MAGIISVSPDTSKMRSPSPSSQDLWPPAISGEGVNTGRGPSASGNSRRLQFWNLTGCIYAKHMCSAAETDPARTAIGQIDDL